MLIYHSYPQGLAYTVSARSSPRRRERQTKVQVVPTLIIDSSLSCHESQTLSNLLWPNGRTLRAPLPHWLFLHHFLNFPCHPQEQKGSSLEECHSWRFPGKKIPKAAQSCPRITGPWPQRRETECSLLTLEDAKRKRCSAGNGSLLALHVRLKLWSLALPAGRQFLRSKTLSSDDSCWGWGRSGSELRVAFWLLPTPLLKEMV